MKILMVCLGNICRSPIAEGMMRHKALEHGMDWEIDSAGTESLHSGEPPHLFSQLVCMENGIDISEQRARQIVPADLKYYDKIYAMAADVYRGIQSMAAAQLDTEGMSKVDFFLNELYPKCNGTVPDPWYGPEEGYKEVFELIDKTTSAIIRNYAPVEATLN